MLKLLSKLLMPSIIGGVIFVGIGDSFLPKPLSTYSRDARNTINAKMLGLMPHQKKVDSFKERVRNQTDPTLLINHTMDKAEKGKQ